MPTLKNLVTEHTNFVPKEVDWLHLLSGELQLLADLSYADVVLWVRTKDKKYMAVAQNRPTNAPTLFYRDLVGKSASTEWFEKIDTAYRTGLTVNAETAEWYEETPTRVQAVPVSSNYPATDTTEAIHGRIAVLTRHNNLSDPRTPSRQEINFNYCADTLCEMIMMGEFPDFNSPSSPRRGAPRASDGLILLDLDGMVTFASPNSVSAFSRMGLAHELEGLSLAEVSSEILAGKLIADESLPVVVSGKGAWRSDIEAQGVTVSLRSVPLRKGGKRIGAFVLSRDVTEQRKQERELITKDATIREIHHRVKNNLQTVGSLLRIQERRTQSELAKQSLNQAITRVGAIAVVHDTLSEGLSQNVNFDLVFERVMLLIAEVASVHGTPVRPSVIGEFGVLPSEYATPLALALTELVTNAVEHGLADREGTVEIRAHRDEGFLNVEVVDDGGGLPEGKVGSGLGTQIVRTLIQGELSGTIEWKNIPSGGTSVAIRVPLRWIGQT